jgi:hypothetical protein
MKKKNTFFCHPSAMCNQAGKSQKHQNTRNLSFGEIWCIGVLVANIKET